MRNPVAQQRVGEEPDAVEVDEDSRVTDVFDARHGVTLEREVGPVRPDLPQAYTQSLRLCASGSDSSFLSVLFSIWRIRSRVTPKA